MTWSPIVARREASNIIAAMMGRSWRWGLAAVWGASASACAPSTVSAVCQKNRSESLEDDGLGLWLVDRD